VGQAIGQVLTYGVGVALSPIPIIAVVLMLGTRLARSNGPAFVCGWVAGLAVVGTIVLLVAGGADAATADGPATWLSVLKLLLGALLVLLAVHQWRGRPRGSEPGQLPRWMRSIDRFGPARSVAVGAALSAVNPKNLLLTVGAATAIAQVGAGAGSEAVAMVVFVLVATLGPGIPVAIYLAMGARAERVLGEMKAWMAANNTAIMAVLCLVIGAKLLGEGISGLA
jgi:threonine/homoserine/homoserine lactone efflux protein